MPIKPSSDGPQRCDRYEAQLSDGHLIELHAALMDGKRSLADIRKSLPPWKQGRFAGKPVSLATLSFIRDRLVMQARMSEDEETTETLLEQWRKSVPTLSDAQIDELGVKTFSLLALRSGDHKAFVSIRSAHNQAQIEKTKLALKEREAARLDQQLALEKEKWETLTAEKVLDAANDAAIQLIATQTAMGRKAQIALIREKMFGQVESMANLKTEGQP
jgi:hypothetical protein